MLLILGTFSILILRARKTPADTSRMAVIAAGQTIGIAPKANLFLAKTKNNYRHKYNHDEIHVGQLQPQALWYVGNEILNHMNKRLGQDADAKSVINMSWGRFLMFSYEITVVTGCIGKRMSDPGADEVDQYFNAVFLPYTRQHKIPVVVAAGNKPIVRNLHSGTPQHLGTHDNNIITVGAVNKDGTLWENTAVPDPTKDGSLTVFAPGEVSEKHSETI